LAILDAVEHRGERITIVRRGKAVALLEPVLSGRGSDVKTMLRRHGVDTEWRADLTSVRELITVEERS
jgi:antitoxin (DNA-binding transcriptional repressor) of toxin-antitoxin stability system